MGIPVALTTTRKRRVVSLSDTCVDIKASNLAEYNKDYDISHLVIADEDDDGLPPVYYNIRAVSNDEWMSAVGNCRGDAGDINLELFAIGCERIDDLMWKDDDGKVMMLKPEGQQIILSGSKRRLRPDVCERIPASIRREIGIVIFMMSKLTEDHRKN